MKNLFALLALLAAVSVTACDDCAADDAGTESTCLDGGMGGTTGGTGGEGGTGGAGAVEAGTTGGTTVEPVSCAMPVHTGVSSDNMEGLCGETAADCGAGLAYAGDDACTGVCCIPAEEIERIQQDTFKPGTMTLASCTTEREGVCVEKGSCDGAVEGYEEVSGACPDAEDGTLTICCQPQ